MHTKLIKSTLIGTTTFFLALFTVHWSTQGGLKTQFNSAEARIGRPATPISGAGVARRHNVNRVGVYRNTNSVNVYRNTNVVGVNRGGVVAAIAIGTAVSTLPRNCATNYINGGYYYSCGSDYYRRSGNGYVVVAPPR